MNKLHLLFLLLALTVGYLAHVQNERNKFFSSLAIPDETHGKDQCHVLKGALSAEDVVVWNDVVLTTDMDYVSLIVRGDPEYEHSLPYFPVSNPSKARPGNIHAVYGLKDAKDLDQVKKMKLETVEMHGFPSDTAFHAHGFDLFDDFLFVVNHAYNQGGERVDIFLLKQDTEGRVSIDFVESVDLSECCMGILNDVTPVSPNEFYATTYLPFKDHSYGQRHGFIVDYLRKFMSSGPLFLDCTSVVRCSKEGSSWSCQEVVQGETFNGIIALPKKNKILVNELYKASVNVYARDPKDGSLTFEKRFPLRQIIDNINILNEDELILAGLTDREGGAAYRVDVAENETKESIRGGPSPNGHQIKGHATVLNMNTGEEHDVVVHHGSMYGGIASAIQIGKWTVMGSFIDDGVMICKT